MHLIVLWSLEGISYRHHSLDHSIHEVYFLWGKLSSLATPFLLALGIRTLRAFHTRRSSLSRISLYAT